MSKKTIIIAVVLFAIIALSVGGYFMYKKLQEGDEGGGEPAGDGGGNPAPGSANLEAVKKNIGGGAVWGKNKEFVRIKFGGDKYFADFYANNRVIIFDSSSKPIRRGAYKDGGKTILMDNGVTASSGSVWANLSEAIK